MLSLSGTEEEIAQGLEHTHLHHAHDVIPSRNGNVWVPDIGKVARAPGVLPGMVSMSAASLRTLLKVSHLVSVRGVSHGARHLRDGEVVEGIL